MFSWSPDVTLYLGALAALVVLLGLVQGLTRNYYVRRRVRFTIILLLVAAAIQVGFHYYYATPKKELSDLSFILTALAVVRALVTLTLNPFRQDVVPDRFPSIVQDAVIVGAFVIVATILIPEKLLTASAIGGLVLGLALQDTLGNLFAGLAIQLEKPFRVGDWVKASHFEGRVSEVTWRATKIRTKSGNFVVIPNSLVSKDTVVNYTRPSPIQRLEFTVGLPYDVAPNRAKSVMLQTAADVPDILKEPSPDVLLVHYADFAINYKCRFWVNDFAFTDPVIDKFATLLYYRLQRSRIQIPFPIRDVRIASEAPRLEETGIRVRTQFVERVELFRDLNSEEKALIAEGMEPITFAAVETIMRQGDPGDSMFFIKEGTVRVLLKTGKEVHQVATLRDGDYFGEMALLTGEPRSATIIAESDVSAYILRKKALRDVLVRAPGIMGQISRTMAARRAELEKEASQVAARTPASQRDEQENFLSRIQKFFGL